MQQYLSHETARYSLHFDRIGNYTLVRRADKASHYFQGDDARLWDRNMEAILDLDASKSWAPGHSLDTSFDFLCSGYDDILKAT